MFYVGMHIFRNTFDCYYGKKSPTERTRRISEQIKRDVSILIQRELRDPRIGMVTIQDVQLTPDYAHAKLYFTVMGAEPANAEKGLNEAAGFIRNALFKMLQIHTVPTLHFAYDNTEAKAADLSLLITQANASRAADFEEDSASDAESK